MRSKGDSKQGKKQQQAPKRVPTPDRVQALENEPAAAAQRAATAGPQALSPNDVLGLQQTVGNRTVQRVLDSDLLIPAWDGGRMRQVGPAATVCDPETGAAQQAEVAKAE